MPRILLPMLAALAALVLPTRAHADPAPAGAIVVTDPGDTGGKCEAGKPCTLRGAIETANANPGPDTIAFNLALTRRIVPEKALPAITQQVTIDGFTQAGMTQATGPLIELDGSKIKANAGQAKAATGGATTAAPASDPTTKRKQAVATEPVRFLRPWGLDLRDADGSMIRGLIIHDFPYLQIGMDGTDQATIKGNWLGLDATGEPQKTPTAADQRVGLGMINSAQATVGGPGRDKNVVSGNDHGIVAYDAGSTGSVILGNYVGTTTDGLGARPNALEGILLTFPVETANRGTSDFFIGGNVVLGGGAAKGAIGIDLLESDNTSIMGNFVGLNAAGLAKSPTGEPLGNETGIFVRDSPKTQVGGSGTAEFNLVAGSQLGIELVGGSKDSTIAGNRVGTNYDGDKVIDGSPNVFGIAVVADFDAEAPVDPKVTDNTVAGSIETGMYVTGTTQRAVVSGNRFEQANKVGFATGFARNGTGAPTNLVFGPANVVVATLTDGIQMMGGENAVVTGNSIVGNDGTGINVGGDAVTLKDNTVTENPQGVAVSGDRTQLLGNRVIDNSGAGVLIRGSHTRVGGSERAAGNLISGNARGVQVIEEAEDTVVRQNYIGTDDTGAVAQPNGIGIALQGGTDTVIGGALGIDGRNLIAHNEDAGIRISGAAKTTVIGNFITDNDGPGVLADGRGGDAVIGWGVESGAPMDDVECRVDRCNRIERNRGAGVRVEVGAKVTVRGNRMRGNTGLDVDLGGPGATQNDDADVDEWLNTPTGVSLIEPDRVGGLLATQEPENTLIDLYGFTGGELLRGRPRGGEYLGSTRPTATGDWALDTTKRYAAYGAVVTDRDGTTSELSPACSGDRDGDALCDNWETSGIDYDADGTPELQLPDADPMKPDLYVEVDYQPGTKPALRALYDVKRAFELAPREITLHTALDEEVPSGGSINTDGRSVGLDNDVVDYTRGGNLPCRGYFGSEEDREAANCIARLGARKLAYRHALFAEKEKQGYSGAADPGGDAFVVALGNLGREDVMIGGGSGAKGCNRQYDACVAQWQASVFMHELGHTLGLLHGGDKTGENEEPNYLSVMNYLFMTRSPVNSRPLDFSRKTPVAIDEVHVDEAAPLFDSYPQRAEDPWTETAVTTYDRDVDKCRVFLVGVTQSPIDLDFDGKTTTLPMGLNDPDGDNDPNGLEECQKPANQTVLTGIDDWSRLRYSRLGLLGWDQDRFSGGERAPKATKLASLIDTDGDGIDDDVDVCPAAKDPGQEDADHDGLGDACLPFITERDVSLTIDAASANLPLGEEREIEVVAANSYPKPATGVVVGITPPTGVEASTTRWDVGEIPAAGSKTLTVKLKGVTAGRGALTAEVLALTEPDWDSAPNNHDPAEDDQAAKRFTVHAAGATPTIAVTDVTLREGDDGQRLARVRIRLDASGGLSVSGRVRTADRTATAGLDYAAVDAPFEIAPFGTETSVDVPILGDTLDEPDETLAIELSGIDGATPETLAGVLTITDDDDPLTPGHVGWLGCASRDFGAGGSCPRREPAFGNSPSGDKTLTPDGRFLWVPDTRRLVRLERNATTGALSKGMCYSTDGTDQRGCTTLPGASLEPNDLAVTPDGTRLLALGGSSVADGGALAAFALDPATGEPAYDSCVGLGGEGCTTPLDATAMIVAPDGRHVLTFDGGQRGDHGEITVYPLAGGHLQPAARCYAHPSENKPCEPLTVNLDGIPYTDFSKDGTTLAVRTKGSLALLAYDGAAGTLALDGGCVREGAGCRPATACTLNRDKEFVCERAPDALASIGPVRFAPDGRALYLASHDENRVTALPRVAERAYALDDAPCVGRADTAGCPVKADLVDEALELLVSPDSNDVYVAGYGNGITALTADRITGALSQPRCAMGDLAGIGSCDRSSPQRSGVYSFSRGNLVIDASGRDLYAPAWLGGNDYGVSQFLRITRPPGGGNRAPICSDTDASVLPGATVELGLRCIDPDGDPVTLRITRGTAQLDGTRLRVTAPVSAGEEVVGFKASDGSLDSAEAIFRILVGNPPTCNDAQVGVEAGSAVAVPLACDRGDLDIVERPLYGALLADGTFRATERDGVERVRFVSRDAGTGVQSNVATVTITVRPRPKGPDTVPFGSAGLENNRGGGGCSGSSCRPSPSGDLPFPMRCNGSATTTPGTCSGTLEACSASGCKRSTGGNLAYAAALKGSLGKAKFSIPVGKSKTVKLRLNAKARKELKKKGKLVLRVYTDVRLPDGRRVKTSRKLTIKRTRR